MWCAARHCAFESHPLRHKNAEFERVQRFSYFPLAKGAPAGVSLNLSLHGLRKGGNSPRGCART